MKRKLLSLLVLILFVFSCNPRENIVTFYLDNEISKQLILNATIGDAGSSTVFSEEDVDLLESETFRKYFLNIVELEVTAIDITVSGYNQGITNPTIKLGNSINFENLSLENGTFRVNDPQILSSISNELLNQQIIQFSFEGEAIAQDTFNVAVSISLKGAFTD